ncbi:hypothetical protein F8388_001192 [Cannabis sativa]|uniref:Uncharacterized protein n=1 Tax=Cannabis sativa TaxID=3483 RepID=A0A7J6ESA6_CANSA|nr:hypothetical protein F8388_001192 [Cannabis sativa]KAF4377053.1 hypothetical protein G4B88_023839 [Cannabis sativa]
MGIFMRSLSTLFVLLLLLLSTVVASADHALRTASAVMFAELRAFQVATAVTLAAVVFALKIAKMLIN